MRGNLVCLMGVETVHGPIPAHAGEPRLENCQDKSQMAYPRACGGTPLHSKRGQFLRGLSPRMRGNRDLLEKLIHGSGPIPAHAGEPGVFLRLFKKLRAYPRACGGTPICLVLCTFLPGLSPRMRGNLVTATNFAGRSGPIPAHAGEPRASAVVQFARGAYPRACGGTKTV